MAELSLFLFPAPRMVISSDPAIIRMRPLFLAVFIALMIGAAKDATAYTVIGYGAQTCGKWTQDRNNNGLIARLDEAWLLGFVSARSGSSQAGFDITQNADNAGLFAWIDNYCAAHPLDMIADAADRLVTYLETRRR
jgi:hypothetical protein